MWNIFGIVNRIKEIVSFELGNEIYKIEKEKKSGLAWGLRNFSMSHALDKTKDIFLYFFTEVKTSICLILFTKFSQHDAIDIVGLSSM